MEIKYTPEAKITMTDSMYRLLSNRLPKSTHESNYIAETLLEMYDIKEIRNGKFLLKFTFINDYQWEYPGIK